MNARPRRSSSDPDLLRMKDLVAETGLTRDTIHFYIAEGLVPAPKKKRRNMAWYGAEHLDRLNAIKRLQQERFLPLRAIKEVLTDGGRDPSVTFTEGQRRLIDRLRTEMAGDLSARPQRVSLRESGMGGEFSEDELVELAQRSVIELERVGDDVFVSADDAEILAGLAEIKRVVNRPEGSWRPEDWAVLDRLAGQLIDYEISVFAQRFPDVGSRPIDDVVDTTIPIINRVFGIFHMKRIRRFLSAFGAGSAATPGAEASPEPRPGRGRKRKRPAPSGRRAARKSPKLA